MNSASSSDERGIGPKVVVFALYIAVLPTLGLWQARAQNTLTSSKVDPRIEAFALDGGRKRELIDGMEKSEVIAQLRLVRRRYEKIYSYGDSKAMYADEALLRMGDEETILRLMNQYHKGEGHGESVLMAANETALRFLIKDVRTGSVEGRRVASDAWDLPIRYKSAQRLLFIVEHGKDFPDATRKWADRMHTYVGVYGEAEKTTKAVLNWWDKNEVAILEGRYADATWLPAAAEESDPENQRTLRRPGDDKRDSLSNGGLGDDGQHSKTAQASNHKMNDRINVAFYVAGAVLFGFIVWLLMRNRMRRSKRK